MSARGVSKLTAHGMRFGKLIAHRARASALTYGVLGQKCLG